MKNKILYLTRGAAVAALYVLLTYLSSLLALDKGVIQFRLSEALCILPVFMPEAIPGLFIGCFVANFLTGSLFLDVVFGSIATLIGAIGARLLRKISPKHIWIATLPTVFANALIIPFVLKYVYLVPDLIPFMMLTVGAGEVVCASVLGTALYFSLKKSYFNK